MRPYWFQASHYSGVFQAPWDLKSQATRPFVQQIVHTDIYESI